MHYKKGISYLLSFVISILLILIILMTSIKMVTFSKGFYRQQYEVLNSVQEVGMTQDDLYRVTTQLLDYIRGDRDDLETIQAEVNGEMQQVFNQREIEHMVDVKELFDFGFSLRDISILLIILLGIILYFYSQKRPLLYLPKAYLSTALFLLLMSGLLYILMRTDFTRYWDEFHYIFFDNDLWQLDPKTDILIRMVPEPFFFAAVSRVVTYFAIGMSVPVIASIYILVKKIGISER